MADALRWLQHKGDESKQPTKKQNDDGFKDILYSLSWLKKHGYDLDMTAQAVEDIDKQQELSVDESAGKESDAPSVGSMMIALGAVSDESSGVSNTDPASDESGPGKSKKSSSDDMKSALDWLSKKGIKIPICLPIKDKGYLI